MKTLVIKRGATGDVVRTSVLLRKLEGKVTWVTEQKNRCLLEGIGDPEFTGRLRVLSWEERHLIAGERFDLAINLEDEEETAGVLDSVAFDRLFGAYLDANGEMTYTGDARPWFDLSLISRFGREVADELKLLNRRSYQDLLFEGLDFVFGGESYVLPGRVETDLKGDVAIAPVAGPVWPMKNWAYYGELIEELESMGLEVNVLPKRETLIEHMSDVLNHRCLVGGDSLPMHFALGAGIPCVSIFTCTSPWEIHDYGVQTKIVSPLLSEFFYRRGMDERATKAIGMEEVLEATLHRLHAPAGATDGAIPLLEPVARRAKAG